VTRHSAEEQDYYGRTLEESWPRLSKPTSHLRLFIDVLLIGVGGNAASAVAWRCTDGSSNAGEHVSRPVLAWDLA
jgi:hypothetical protein